MTGYSAPAQWGHLGRPPSARRLSSVSLLDPARIMEGVGIALESIRVNKIRAALTILGVAIGVMVVIAMASMITGINRAVSGMLEKAGPKTFMVMRYFREGVQIDDGSENPEDKNPYLTVPEARMLQRLPGIAEVAWRDEVGGPLAAGNVTLKSAWIIGATPNMMKAGGGYLAAGRNFTEIEAAASAYVIIINDRSAEQLFPGLDPLGRKVKAFGIPFTVVGLYSEPASLFSGAASNPIAVIPHSTFTKVAEYERGWMMIMVKPDDSVSVAAAQDRVITALRVKRGLKPSQENNFGVVTQDKMLAIFNQVTGGFFLVMLALSSVGLMVGGIGVIAIMMISVTERTREIGVRKALGATKREIMFQFLVEAATLTVLGGTIGMLRGGGIAWAVNRFTPIPATVPLWSVVAALLASAVTGVFFGLYPASRAARLDPVEALRYE
jgi:putative ABC transport system permease protein